MIYNEYAIEKRDFTRIAKLNKLTDASTFWADVRKLTKSTTSDHALHRWQVLAEARFDEIRKA